MARYMIRVELHEAKKADYDRLYKLLADLEITDVVVDQVGEPGTEWRLPTGEYRYFGTESGDVLLEAVHDLALKVAASASVMITEVTWMRWKGLDSLG